MRINPRNIPWRIWIFSRIGLGLHRVGVPWCMCERFVAVGVRGSCMIAQIMNFPEGLLRQHVAAYLRSAPAPGEPRLGFTVRFLACSCYSIFVLLPFWLVRDFTRWLRRRFVATSSEGAAAARSHEIPRDFTAASPFSGWQVGAGASEPFFSENALGRAEGCHDTGKRSPCASTPRRSAAKGLPVKSQTQFGSLIP
jgi:hypothetical protein